MKVLEDKQERIQWLYSGHTGTLQTIPRREFQLVNAEDDQIGQRKSLEEFIRQMGNQSALLAGFAFVGLVSFAANNEAHQHLQMAFVFCSSLVVAVELLTLFVTGLLSFAVQLGNRDDYWWYSFCSFVWFSHFAGLQGFLVSLSMFVWIKWRLVAVPVVAMCVIASAAMIANLYLIGRRFE